MKRAPVRRKDSGTSSRLCTWLGARRKALLDFCCRLIEAPSTNPPGDERRVIEVISAELERLGLDDREILASKPTRPNALVWVRGTGPGPVLCYAGHTDTKPVGD